MRIVFGALSLLIVLAIVGVVAKKQLTSAPRASGETAAGVVVPGGTPKQQVDAVKQSVDNAIQQSRPVDDTK